MTASYRKQGGQAEARILPPDVPHFILNDEAQRIRPAWSEKRHPPHITIPCGRDTPVTA
jgi:hypothetical protein